MLFLLQKVQKIMWICFLFYYHLQNNYKCASDTCKKFPMTNFHRTYFRFVENLLGYMKNWAHISKLIWIYLIYFQVALDISKSEHKKCSLFVFTFTNIQGQHFTKNDILRIYVLLYREEVNFSVKNTVFFKIPKMPWILVKSEHLKSVHFY